MPLEARLGALHGKTSENTTGYRDDPSGTAGHTLLAGNAQSAPVWCSEQPDGGSRVLQCPHTET